MSTTYRTITASILVQLCLTSVVFAQTRMSSQVVSSGAQFSSNPLTSLRATVGQSIIFRSTGSNSILSQGFWYTQTTPSATFVEQEQSTSQLDELSVETLPNPCIDLLRVRFQAHNRRVQIKILNEIGSVVVERLVDELNGSPAELSIDCSALVSGSYTLHITDGAQTKLGRFVVLH